MRRRVEELVGSGMLYFDLDVDSEHLGLRSRANFWASVAPSALMAVGAALTEHREVPFVAATTGRTNLMASLACSDDVALFEFLTREIAGLDGVTHLETSQVIRSLKMHTTLNRPVKRNSPIVFETTPSSSRKKVDCVSTVNQPHFSDGSAARSIGSG